MFITLTCVLLFAGICTAITLPLLPKNLQELGNGTSQFPIPIPGNRLPASHFRYAINKDKEFFDTKVIPEDNQVAAFLYKEETKL
jgi:hypothetical protein